MFLLSEKTIIERDLKMNDSNFIKLNTSREDRDLFFGPIEDDTYIIIEDHWIMSHVMHKAGIFPSVSQARKNGWNKPIPKGFSHFVVGKKKRQIFIFIEK
jgi:hypothetical protein